MDRDGLTPYFLTNDEWFVLDEETSRPRLTEAGKQIPEVVESYEEEQKFRKWCDEHGIDV